MMKRAEIVAFSLTLTVLTATQAVADTIDPFATRQSLSTTANKHSASIVNAAEALGGRRRANIILLDTGTLSLDIGSGAAAYKLVGGGAQSLHSAQIGWLWYVDPSSAITPVDLTRGGKYDAFQIEVLEVTAPVVLQIDALDADMRFDSVAILVETTPGQPLVYDFSHFVTPRSPQKVDFTRIIGVQVEFDLRSSGAGSVKLGPLTTIKSSPSPGAKEPTAARE